MGGMEAPTLDKKGKFIVIDGMDGSGKGTQIKLLKETLEGRGVLFTREPGGSPKAEEIRSMILNADDSQSNAACDFFLFWAARASHIEEVVEPARAAGTHVMCDRYDSSTFAFQICGEGRYPWLGSLFERIRNSLPEKYKPDAYLVLDLPPEVAFERRRADMQQEKSKFDILPLEYHARVREGFHLFSDRFGPVTFIDASRTPQEIHSSIWAILTSMV
jgi:dTMP kinase